MSYEILKLEEINNKQKLDQSYLELNGRIIYSLTTINCFLLSRKSIEVY